jgi:hypothetical protein
MRGRPEDGRDPLGEVSFRAPWVRPRAPGAGPVVTIPLWCSDSPFPARASSLPHPPSRERGRPTPPIGTAVPNAFEVFNPVVHQAEGALCARFDLPIHLGPVLLARHAEHAGITVEAMAERIVDDLRRRSEERAAPDPDEAGGRTTNCRPRGARRPR